MMGRSSLSSFPSFPRDEPGHGTRNEELWGHTQFEYFDWLFENKEILNGSENMDGENLELPQKFTSINFVEDLEEETEDERDYGQKRRGISTLIKRLKI